MREYVPTTSRPRVVSRSGFCYWDGFLARVVNNSATFSSTGVGMLCIGIAIAAPGRRRLHRFSAISALFEPRQTKRRQGIAHVQKNYGVGRAAPGHGAGGC